MRENGCRDNPSGSFRGETTQIHSIPSFSPTIGLRTLGCQFMCMPYVPLVCLGVDVAVYNPLQLFLKSSMQNLALTSSWNLSLCAVCLQTTDFRWSINVQDTWARPIHFVSVWWDHSCFHRRLACTPSKDFSVCRPNTSKV